MEERYIIQGAFKKHKEIMQYGQSPGHYFLQLTKEIVDANGVFQSILVETFYAFPVSKEVEAQACAKSFNITIPTSFLSLSKKWKVYCFEGDFHKAYPFSVKPDYTQIIYGHESNQIDAKNRWEQAKANLQKLDINIPNPKSIAFGDIIRNNSYHALANMMAVEPYTLQNNLSTSTSTRSSHTFTNSSQVNLSIDKGPIPLVSYEIHAAVNHVFVRILGWKMYSFPWPVGHHFYVLVENRDGQKTMIESIHGLATQFQADQYGNLSPRIANVVGTWHSTIKLYVLKHPSTQEKNENFLSPPWIEPWETHPIYKEQDALARWTYLKSCLGKLNEVEKPYSFCGYGWNFWRFFIEGFFIKGCNANTLHALPANNCNTAYAAIAAILGIKPHKFERYVAPGSCSEMLEKKEIAELSCNEAIHRVNEIRLSA